MKIIKLAHNSLKNVFDKKSIKTYIIVIVILTTSMFIVDEIYYTLPMPEIVQYKERPDNYTPEIHSIDGSHLSEINYILSYTDQRILNEIDNISVVNEEYISTLCKRKFTLGCTLQYVHENNETTTEIFIVGEMYWNQSTVDIAIGSSFEIILNHEIGHVLGRMTNSNSEAFARKYSKAKSVI